MYTTDIHSIDTTDIRQKRNLRVNQIKSSSGLHTTRCFSFKEWNSIPMDITKIIIIHLRGNCGNC